MASDSDLQFKVLVPPMERFARHPLRVMGTFLLVTLVLGAVVPDVFEYLELLRIVAIATTSTVLVSAGAVRAANRLPRKPREPKRQMARLKSPGREPATRIPLPVYRCLICNRPLKNAESQLAGVGPDCRARYGARPQYQPNPAHAVWQQRMAEAQREQQTRQREFDTVFAKAKAEHPANVHRWDAALRTPQNVRRREVRTAAKRTVVVDLGVLLSFALSEGVVRLAAALELPFYS